MDKGTAILAAAFVRVRACLPMALALAIAAAALQLAPARASPGMAPVRACRGCPHVARVASRRRHP
jgi:hypothetical protein